MRQSTAGRWICSVSWSATASFVEERLRPKMDGAPPSLMGKKPWVAVANRPGGRDSVEFPENGTGLLLLLLQGVKHSGQLRGVAGQ
jgi:hypothetical protein